MTMKTKVILAGLIACIGITAQAAIVGAQFKLGKYVKIAPNFRMSMPKADGAKNDYSAYVSCYFGL